GCDRLPARQAPQHQEQLGVLRFDEYLIRQARVSGRAPYASGAPFLAGFYVASFAAVRAQHGERRGMLLIPRKYLKYMMIAAAWLQQNPPSPDVMQQNCCIHAAANGAQRRS